MHDLNCQSFLPWDYYISNSPIYLTRGGMINMIGGALTVAGRTGDYWLRTAFYNEVVAAYRAELDAINVYPSRENHRWVGFTVWIQNIGK